jgi:hypothetical protein
MNVPIVVPNAAADGAHPILVGVGGAHAARAWGQVGKRQGKQARYASELTAQVIRVASLADADRGDVLAARDGGLICGNGYCFFRHLIPPVKPVLLDSANDIKNDERQPEQPNQAA